MRLALLHVLLTCLFLPLGASAADLREVLHQELGYLDYVDELTPSTFRVEHAQDLEDGVQRVEVGGVLTNTGGAIFDTAVLLPDFSAADLDVRRVVQGARFPALAPAGPGGEASSDEPLIVELPAAHVAALLTALEEGTVPISVFASEVPQLNPGVWMVDWTSAEDVAYENAQDFGLNGSDPFGAAPWDPSEQHTVALYYPLLPPAAFLAFDSATESMFLRPAAGEPPEVVPEGFHYFTVDDLTVQDIEDAGTMVTITGHVSTEESLLRAYEYAGFSTTTAEQIDRPVGATRIAELDGIPLDAEYKDSLTLPLRFNGLDLFEGAVSLSGQVHGHALKPWVALRIRPGAHRLQLGIETDVSLSAELRATGLAKDSGELPLYDLCFPLPDLVFGPVEVPMTLSLEQSLFAEVELQAGMAVGISHRVQHGYVVTCDGDDDGVTCATDEIRSPGSPLRLSPPELTRYARAYATIGTRFGTTLHLASEYPVCTGALNVRLGAEIWGRTDVDPSAEPWWSMHHGGSIDGTVALELFGVEPIEHEVELFTYESEPARVAPSPPPDPSQNARYLSGEDQRWMVAIDQFETVNGGLDEVHAVAMEDGAITYVASGLGAYRLGQLDRYGALRWNQRYLPTGNRRAEALHVTDDDTILVAGSFAFVAAHRPEGDVIWARDYDFSEGPDDAPGITIRDVTAFVNLGGGWDPTAIGTLSRGRVGEDDGFVARLDPNGDVLWAKVYDGPGRQTFDAAIVAENGDLVVVGGTDPDVYGRKGLILRINGDDGELLWSRSLVTRVRGGALYGVVEGADGALYAVGEATRDIRRTGAALIARVEADGSDARLALLLHDVATDEALDDEPVPEVQSSDTGFDALTAVAAVGDGIVVAGHAGLSDSRTAWLARLGPSLGVQWFQVLDGEAGDRFTSVDVADDALIVGGTSRSAIVSSDDDHALVAKVPFEGELTLHESFGHLITRFSMPGVRDAGSDPDIVSDGVTLLDAPLAVLDAVLDSAVDVTSELLAPVQTPECVRLMTSTGHVTTTDPCDDADLWPPVVRIFAGDQGTYSLTASFPLEVTLFDEVGVVASEVTVDGVPTEPGAVLAMDALGVGTHTIEAWAEDGAGNRGSDAVAFEVVDVEDTPSDTGDPTEVETPRRTCGCVTGLPVGALAWGGLLVLVAFRRR